VSGSFRESNRVFHQKYFLNRVHNAKTFKHNFPKLFPTNAFQISPA